MFSSISGYGFGLVSFDFESSNLVLLNNSVFHFFPTDRYMFRLINRRVRRINTGSSFRPVLKLCKEEVIWLGLHAYIQVLKKKNSRYRTLLIYLKSALSKQYLSRHLSPALEYAIDRPNSSSLWKLNY